jgi:2'-deoxynucleoside 5'-phosphate N-hydrolase
MKAYLAIKYHEDNQNKVRIRAISAALAQNGIETVCIARDVEQWGQISLSPQELMRQSLAEIDASDLVVVDLTEKGVGVGIEAGYAYAKGIPVVTIAPKGADISETLRGISRQVFWYNDFDELAHFFGQIKFESGFITMKQLAQEVAATWTSPQSGLELIKEQREP